MTAIPLASSQNISAARDSKSPPHDHDSERPPQRSQSQPPPPPLLPPQQQPYFEDVPANTTGTAVSSSNTSFQAQISEASPVAKSRGALEISTILNCPPPSLPIKVTTTPDTLNYPPP